MSVHGVLGCFRCRQLPICTWWRRCGASAAAWSSWRRPRWRCTTPRCHRSWWRRCGRIWEHLHFGTLLACHAALCCCTFHVHHGDGPDVPVLHPTCCLPCACPTLAAACLHAAAAAGDEQCLLFRKRTACCSLSLAQLHDRTLQLQLAIQRMANIKEYRTPQVRGGYKGRKVQVQKGRAR